MIIQYLLKRGKIARGLVYTYFRRRARPYWEAEWWDRDFYTEGVSDARTISASKSIISAHYHYASVQLLILRHLSRQQMDVDGASVLDVGAGSGHWIDFYRSLGATRVTGVDISTAAVQHLRNKYSGDPDIEIVKGTALSVVAGKRACFDVVNAIGVMFHIVDDAELTELVRAAATALRPGGLMVIGGHFGLFHGINLQIDRNDRINKRLRSRRFWRRLLVGAGLTEVRCIANTAYLHISDTLPENNLLVARKP